MQKAIERSRADLADTIALLIRLGYTYPRSQDAGGERASVA